MKSNIVSIGSCVWLFSLNFVQTEILYWSSMLVKSARTISRELFIQKRVHICLTYDKKSVFVFALRIYPFHLMLQIVSFRAMNTSIAYYGDSIRHWFVLKRCGLEKVCFRVPKSLIWHCMSRPIPTAPRVF